MMEIESNRGRGDEKEERIGERVRERNALDETNN
jgi:hypothetical protein